MTDRQLNVPRPRRKVDAFSSPPARGLATPEALEVPADGDAPVRRTPAKRNRAKSTQRQPATKRSDREMVRVHTTLSPEVVGALTDHAETNNATHTEVLAAAFVEHGADLTVDGEVDDRAKYEAFGFRPPRNAKPPRGRMTSTFYMSVKARASLDEAAAAGHFSSRSAFIDALLRRALV